jgi:hypothetical protein
LPFLFPPSYVLLSTIDIYFSFNRLLILEIFQG